MAKEKLFSEFPPVTTQQWEEAIKVDLKGADYNKKLIWKTLDGFDVKPYYREEDLKTLEYLNGNPDEKPFVRGYHTKDNSWDIRQDIDQADINIANKIALEGIKRGVNSVAFNASEVKTAQNIKDLLNGIDLNKIKINFYRSSNYLDLLKLYIAEIKRQRIVDAKQVQGSFNYDPFFYALKHGHFYKTIKSNLDEAEVVIRVAEKELPMFDILTVNGKAFNNSGASIVQELAYTLSAATEYMSELTNRGLTPDEIGQRMVFSYATGSNYFMEIAKIRATRLLWSKIIEQYEFSTSKAAKVHIHTESSMYNKTIFDPYVNMLRTTTETMSAAIAGADSISVYPFDAAYKESDDFSRRIATNQQILLKEEAYMDKIIDPSAGSYYIENLTNNLAENAWKIFLDIEKIGGFTKAIKENYVQDEIEKMHEKRQGDVAKRKTVVVGTNQYPNLSEKPVEVTKKCCCQNGRDCGCKDENEQEFKILRCQRQAKPFENLRLAVNNAEHKPSVFLLTYGNLAMRNARAGFTTNFFGVAGYDIKNNAGFETGRQGADEALKYNPDILVLCSSDDEYEELIKEVMPIVKGKIKNVVVAGNPEKAEEFLQQGITGFINVKTNALETLTKYNEELVK
jgi:methylmalonyl-CoA mutase